MGEDRVRKWIKNIDWELVKTIVSLLLVLIVTLVLLVFGLAQTIACYQKYGLADFVHYCTQAAVTR